MLKMFSVIILLSSVNILFFVQSLLKSPSSLMFFLENIQKKKKGKTKRKVLLVERIINVKFIMRNGSFFCR